MLLILYFILYLPFRGDKGARLQRKYTLIRTHTDFAFITNKYINTVYVFLLNKTVRLPGGAHYLFSMEIQSKLILLRFRYGFRIAEQSGGSRRILPEYIRRRFGLILTKHYNFQSHLDQIFPTLTQDIFLVSLGVALQQY